VHAENSTCFYEHALSYSSNGEITMNDSMMLMLMLIVMTMVDSTPNQTQE
jgi:hypothetical protein